MTGSPRESQRDPHVSNSASVGTILKDSEERIGALDQTETLGSQASYTWKAHVRKEVKTKEREGKVSSRPWRQSLVSVTVPVLPVVYMSIMATHVLLSGEGAQELFASKIGNGDCPRRPWWWPVC